jgi:hypothetical protein
MPDDNRFEGLGDALDEAESAADEERATTGEDATTDASTADATTDTSTADATTDTSTADATTDTSTEKTAAGASGPAFPFDATEPTTLYAREESWDRLDDTFFEARAALRERDIRDVETRELHDALLRAAEPETIVDAVESARDD